MKSSKDFKKLVSVEDFLLNIFSCGKRESIFNGEMFLIIDLSKSIEYINKKLRMLLLQQLTQAQLHQQSSNHICCLKSENRIFLSLNFFSNLLNFFKNRYLNFFEISLKQI